MKKQYKVTKRTNKKKISKRTNKKKISKRTNKKKISKRTNKKKQTTKKTGMPSIQSIYIDNDSNSNSNSNRVNSNNNNNRMNNNIYVSNDNTIIMEANSSNYSGSIIPDFDNIPLDSNVRIVEADSEFTLIYSYLNIVLSIKLVLDHANEKVNIIIFYNNPNNIQNVDESFLIRKHVYYLIEYSIRRNFDINIDSYNVENIFLNDNIPNVYIDTDIPIDIRNIMINFMDPQNVDKKLVILQTNIQNNDGVILTQRLGR